MIIPQISDNPEIQRRYEAMRFSGESHNMASVLALRQFPGIGGTDKAWNRGRVNGNQFANCPALGDYYRGIAARAGVSTAGRYYCHGLGRFPGDPRAWCSDTSDVLRIARERNLSIDGVVTHKAHETEPLPDVPLAPDIWERETQALLAESPGMRYEDAREKAFALRTSQGEPPPVDLAETLAAIPGEMFTEDE